MTRDLQPLKAIEVFRLMFQHPPKDWKNTQWKAFWQSIQIHVFTKHKKTLMRRMRELNLDFLVKKVPQVLPHLNKVDEPN